MLFFRKKPGLGSSWGKKIAMGFLVVLASGWLLWHYLKAWHQTTDFAWAQGVWAAELEIERLWHRLWRPALEPARYAKVTPEALERSMKLGADWILAMQEDSGRFHYWYRPSLQQLSHSEDDNFLRQAGTGYSLMLVYEMTGDERYLRAAQANLRYLLLFQKSLEQDKLYFFHQETAKLGGIALPMLTMLKLKELTGTNEYDSVLQGLAEMILFLQKKYNNGRYKSTYVYRGDYEYETTKGWHSKIYPGEAMLALVMMYQAFADERYKKSVDWALEFYSAPEEWRSHAFLAWTISAFVKLHRLHPENRYRDYVWELTEFLFTQQNFDPDDEVYGSFHALPHANTASYMEGLGDSIFLAQVTGEPERYARYSEHAKLGIHWLLKLQYSHHEAQGQPHAEKITGGFRSSLFDDTLRIDNTQHAIASLTKALRYIFGREPRVRAFVAQP